MHLSRIRVTNFRNFSDFDVTLGGNVVVVGENRVGKSNLLYALTALGNSACPTFGMDWEHPPLKKKSSSLWRSRTLKRIWMFSPS
jgi:predicted ATP-dependent endonuclease of OLD family